VALSTSTIILSNTCDIFRKFVITASIYYSIITSSYWRIMAERIMRDRNPSLRRRTREYTSWVPIL